MIALRSFGLGYALTRQCKLGVQMPPNFLSSKFLFQEYVQNEEKNELPFDINNVILSTSSV